MAWKSWRKNCTWRTDPARAYMRKQAVDLLTRQVGVNGSAAIGVDENTRAQDELG